jgi:hypothetical protein
METTPIIVERFTCNGEHSHWESINPETGEVVMTQPNIQAIAREIMTEITDTYFVESLHGYPGNDTENMNKLIEQILTKHLK